MDDHRFVIPAGSGWQQATFRLQLFTGTELRPIVVITQVVPTEGAGPVNHAQRYGGALWQRLMPNEPRPPILIGRMLTYTGEGDEMRDYGLMAIDFAVTDRAQYTCKPIGDGRLSVAELEYLVGRPVDLSRGTFQAPRQRRWWSSR